MGDQAIHAEAAQPQGLVADSYRIIAFSGLELPLQYRSLVYSKWLRSLRYGNDFFKLIEADAYYNAYHKHISLILSAPGSMVRLAVLSDDKDVVLGFSVSRFLALDYIHVHKDHRKCGIGTKLIPVGIDTITHVTKTALIIWPSKYGHWKFNPFA